MYDHLTRATEEERRQKGLVQSQINTHVGGIMATVNAQHNQTTASLAHIAGFLPWLEDCRKTAHDVSHAREEKWRMSSATFHDQARKDRESAEKEILELLKAQKSALDRQNKILVQLCESQGIDVDPNLDDG